MAYRYYNRRSVVLDVGLGKETASDGNFARKNFARNKYFLGKDDLMC